MQYLELSIGNERFCAYPVSGVPRCLWRHFPVRGGARLRCLLRFLSIFRLDRLFLRRTENPIGAYGCEAEKLRLVICEVLHRSDISLAFAWPAPSRSIGRTYAYVFSSNGTMLAYVKMANEEKDVAELAYEVKVLRSLATRGDLSFSFPTVLYEGVIGDGMNYAMFSMLPLDSDNVSWTRRSWDESLRALHDSFARGTEKRLTKDEVLASKWAAAFKARVEFNDKEIFTRTCEKGAEVSANHGDMALHNIRRKDGLWWLFDWETYSEDAPVLVDELTVYVSTRYFIEKCGYEKLVAQMKNDYPIENRDVAVRVVQTAAFIYAYDLSFADEFLCILREYGRGV